MCLPWILRSRGFVSGFLMIDNFITIFLALIIKEEINYSFVCTSPYSQKF